VVLGPAIYRSLVADEQRGFRNTLSKKLRRGAQLLEAANKYWNVIKQQQSEEQQVLMPLLHWPDGRVFNGLKRGRERNKTENSFSTAKFSLAVDLKFWTFACYFAHQIIC
jgi:hypothetical protein